LIASPTSRDRYWVGQYFYDALSRRVARVASPTGVPQETLFYYDDERIVEEQTWAARLSPPYTYGNYLDEVLTMDRSGQTYYYHPNPLWSIAALYGLLRQPGRTVQLRRLRRAGGRDGAGNPVRPTRGHPHSATGNPWLFTAAS